MSTKRVYLFTEGNASMKDLLGGKGANLAEMTRMGLPVPPGFTITTEACNAYQATGRLPEGLMDEVRAGVAALEADLGRRLNDPERPLLLSVRSGAKFSMPGMMDTILNLGLNRKTLLGMAMETDNPRFVYDANRRFLMMFGDVVLGIPRAKFEAIFDAHKERQGVTLDTQLSSEDLQTICREYLTLVLKESGEGFPGNPWTQLEMAIEAVFKSWNNERARVYRRRERIPDDLGTAVNVQAMVFGNLDDTCGTGVAFTRDPSSGERALYGEYLMNAQGEDVVAGVRTPHPIRDLQAQDAALYAQFEGMAKTLEEHFRDMMDLEFTIERGRLFMLQCRVGKRTGQAAVRMAVEMVEEELIPQEEAIRRVTGEHLDQLLHPRIDPAAASRLEPVATGIPASPGAAVGRIVLDASTAEEWARLDEPVLLVRDETNPDDVHGMLVAQGVLTARGGKTSHAAVVARGFGIPCVAGCDALRIDMQARTVAVRGQRLKEGDWLTLDGTEGHVYTEQLKLIPPEVSGHFGTLMGWCDETRRLAIRANADNGHDAALARRFGAEGIGLCRTEHMFFEEDRLPIMRQMLLTDNQVTRDAALSKLQSVQQADFEALFEAMEGLPVTIRLLDPPLHEFLPNHEELVRQVTELRLATNVLGGPSLGEVLEEKEKLLRVVDDMKESNPMMGLRGVRLSLVFPGIIAMQTRAIMRAACKLRKRGHDVQPEIMIPLVGHVRELERARATVERCVEEVQAYFEVEVPVRVGTMIEIPRAALTAGEIAEAAEFFSFGTNDLTQMTFGFSRDDAEAHFLRQYLEDKVLQDNPFETIDQHGVGRLMKIAVEEGRAARPGLKCGICGEHGGEPRSIAFCHGLGLDYVSCSPYRVPVARLAAAQAALADAPSEG
ncbi:MAG: pyruvate, phosphate dikinase [Myxococcales bacterium]|nr:pyruvate, phosphate dikinase [Myxococcales bacterium]